MISLSLSLSLSFSFSFSLCLLCVCVWVCVCVCVCVCGFDSTYAYTVSCLKALTTYSMSASFIYGMTVNYNMNGGLNTALVSGGAVTLNLQV
jgi:hypothetical protein